MTGEELLKWLYIKRESENQKEVYFKAGSVYFPILNIEMDKLKPHGKEVIILDSSREIT